MKLFKNKIHINSRYFNVYTFSVINALFITVLCYVLNNVDLMPSEELDQYTWLAWCKEKINPEEEIRNVVYVNVSYDKQLIEVNDEYGLRKGEEAITNREKLFYFLNALNSKQNYRYIFLDVVFEKGYETPVDSALFRLISNMPRIVVAKHEDILLADSVLDEKTGYVDYATTISNNNFVRFQYGEEHNMSMPLFAYHELTGNSISGKFGIYSCHGNICQKDMFLGLSANDLPEYNADGTKNIYNLGADLCDDEVYNRDDICQLCYDKYIVIGDYNDDMHDTYVGSKPGSLITFTAFWNLMNDKHIVTWKLVLLLVIVYLFISYAIAKRWSPIDHIPGIQKRRILNFALSMLSFTMVLTIIGTIVYIFNNVAISIVIPSFIFSVEKMVVTYKLNR